jgi:hypothetical protein
MDGRVNNSLTCHTAYAVRAVCVVHPCFFVKRVTTCSSKVLVRQMCLVKHTLELATRGGKGTLL